MESDFQVYHFNALKQQIRDIAVKDKAVVFLDPRLVPDWYSNFAGDATPKNVDADVLKFAAGMMGLIDEVVGKGSLSEKDLRDPAGSMKISFTITGLEYLLSGERDKMEWLTHGIDRLGKLTGLEGERYEPILMDLVNLRRFYSRTRQSSESMVFAPEDRGLMGSLEQYLSLIHPPLDQGDISGVSAVARSLASAAVYSALTLRDPTVITPCDDVLPLAECIISSMTEHGKGHLVSAVLASYPISFQILKTNDPAALTAGRNLFRTSTTRSAVGSKKYSIILSSDSGAEEIKGRIGSMISDSAKVRSDQRIIDYQNKKHDGSSQVIPDPAVQIPVVSDPVKVKVIPPSADGAGLGPGDVGSLLASPSETRAATQTVGVYQPKAPVTINPIMPIEAPKRKPRSRPMKPREVVSSQDISEIYRAGPSNGPVPSGPAPDQSSEPAYHPPPIKDSPVKGPDYSRAAQGPAPSSLPPQEPPIQPSVSQVQAPGDFRLGEAETTLEVVIKPGLPWRLKKLERSSDVSIQTDVPGLGSNALQLLSIYQSNPLNPNDEGPVLQQKMGILVVASDLASKAGDDVSYQRICAQIGAAKEFVKRRVAGLNGLIARLDGILDASIDSLVKGDQVLDERQAYAQAKLGGVKTTAAHVTATASRAQKTMPSVNVKDKYDSVPECLRPYIGTDVAFGELAKATGRTRQNVYWAAWNNQLNKTDESGAYVHLSLRNAKKVFPTLFKDYAARLATKKANDRSGDDLDHPKSRGRYAGVPECLRSYIGKDVTFQDLAEATGNKIANIYTAAWSRDLHEKGKFGRLAHMYLSLENAKIVMPYLFKEEDGESDGRKAGSSAGRDTSSRKSIKKRPSSKSSRPQVLTVSEIEDLGVPRSYIYYQVREGNIPFTKDEGLRGKLRIRLTKDARKVLGLR
ncbi:MAG: hypothetical protein AABX47_02670 [Nanoarchaeota archaeon]